MSTPDVSPTVDSLAEKMLNGKINKKRPKRTRKKVVRACAFCRRRKLKCDTARPMCSTCVSRKLQVCIYEEHVDTREVKLEEVFDSVPNVALLKKVEELEKALKAVDPETAAKLKEKETGVVNPFADLYFLQTKGSGRKILYGPTASRTYIRFQTHDFIEKYRKLYAKVKIERNKWKSHHTTPILRELELINSDENTDIESQFKQVIDVLPPFEKICQIIKDFFKVPPHNEISTVLDCSKVLNDFYQEFEPGDYINDGRERKIANIRIGAKRNYYKMAVILMILCISYYYEDVPSVIRKFCIVLTGCSTSKILYLERTQFLLLRYYYREYYAPCGDEIHMLNLVDMLCTSATNIGLHLSHSIYEGQEANVGNLKSVENLWIWVLFADVNVALHVGRPLLINTSLLDDSLPNILDDNEGDSYYSKMKRILKIARVHIQSMYNKRVIPNLVEYCEETTLLVERDFPNLADYTNYELMNSEVLMDIRILSLALNLIITYYSLRFAVNKERSIELKNKILKNSLMSVALVVNITLYCYGQDKILHRNMLNESEYITPYLSFSLSITNCLFQKAITLFCAILYHKLTLFESGKFINKELQDVVENDTTTLRVNSNISLLASFRIYSDMFDKWHNEEISKGMLNVMSRSHTFVVTMALERAHRTLLQKVIEYRTQAEENWLTMSPKGRQKLPPCGCVYDGNMSYNNNSGSSNSNSNSNSNINGSSTITATGPYIGTPNINTTTPLNSHHMTTPIIHRGTVASSPYNINSGYQETQSDAFTTPSIAENDGFLPIATDIPDEQLDTLAQSLADEFWNNYNAGFSELVEGLHYNQLFQDS
ncbi:hypothetical protein RNJ44_05125 [Nakaseomyces bracarensis]|uniref:Zn(2)-C6 fungal-type domain-containing protein n=1 Tax=Nakaseomyces bracarensis TaxID=273131 RepID=A0ABR4NWV8_9SACH